MIPSVPVSLDIEQYHREQLSLLTMENVKIQQAAPGKGRGLFAKRKLSPKTKVYGSNDLALSAISTSQLSHFCYHCYGGSRYEENNWYSIGQNRNADLKVCTGCKVAYFCGKECQTQSWKKYHKFECKIFAKLHPKILPENIRAALRFALQHRNGKISEDAYKAILSLASHVKELEEAGGEDWTNLRLMAKAAKEYSNAESDGLFVLLLCILKTNAMTLQTTANDPIGVFLDPLLAMINHSCDGNIAIYRPVYTNSVGWLQRKQASQVMLALMPLREIEPDEELTITYIDFQEHVDKRRARLKSSYLFDCTCPKCLSDLETEKALTQSDPDFINSWSGWRATADSRLQILSSPPFTADVLAKSISELTEITKAMEACSSFSPDMDPYSRAVHELKLLHMNEEKSCDEALVQAFKEHLIIGPKLYNSDVQPQRIINAIFLLQLIGILDETFQSSHSNGAHMEQHRKEIEKRGLSEQSFGYWRGKVGADMRAFLQDTVAADLAQCFEIELLSSGLERVQEMRSLYDDSSARLRAESEMQKLLGCSDERWEQIKSTWTTSVS